MSDWLIERSWRTSCLGSPHIQQPTAPPFPPSSFDILDLLGGYLEAWGMFPTYVIGFIKSRDLSQFMGPRVKGIKRRECMCEPGRRWIPLDNKCFRNRYMFTPSCCFLGFSSSSNYLLLTDGSRSTHQCVSNCPLVTPALGHQMKKCLNK